MEVTKNMGEQTLTDYRLNYTNGALEMPLE